MAGRPQVRRRARPGTVAAVALAWLCLAPAGCAGRVGLGYLYPQGRVATYRWTIDATTTAVPGAAARHTLHLVVGVREEVAARLSGAGPTPAGHRGSGPSARLRMALTPLETLQDAGTAVPGPPLSLDLDVGPDGRVGRVGGASNLPPAALGALEIDRLLSESRPPLPARAVPLHGRWTAALSSTGTGTGIDLKGSGTLDGFSLQGGRRLAEITILRRGRVTTRQATGQGEVSLEGTASDRTSAELDIDRGLLVSATSTSVSTFAPSGGQTGGKTPGSADLRVELRTHVALTGVRGQVGRAG